MKPEWFSRLWRPSTKKWMFGIPVGAVLMLVIGFVSVPAFNAVMHATGTNEFCYSCHVGMDTVVEEYEASAHFNTRSGIIATCADCHIPREFVPKMVTKTIALKDVYHTIVGTVNLENFEELRPEMAQHVWDIMAETDSRECRNCHSYANMAADKQSRRAARKHSIEGRGDKTCIDCHQGIAHKLPEDNFDDLFD